MKLAKTLYFILSISLFLSTSLTAQKTNGKGAIVTETFNLSEINSIGLGIYADVYLTQGNSQKITVKAQRNVIDNISQKTKGKSWNIKFRENMNKYEKIKIYITIKELKNLSLGGSGKIVGQNKFSGMEDLNISIGGSGSVILDGDAQDIKCNIGGSGKVKIKGRANQLEATIGGSGDINGFDLKVKKCNITIAGSGDVEINVSDKIDAVIAGSGDVYFKGSPTVKSKIVGSGDVKKAN